MMKIILVSGCLASASQALAADVFKYRLGFYPAGDLDCDSVVADLSQRFTAASGKEIFSSSCVVSGQGLVDVELNYISDKELTITTTKSKRLIDNPSSMYRTLSDCMSSLPAETEAFEQSLGLEAMIAFCSRIPEYDIYPYTARIDAVGAPTTELKVFNDTAMFFSPVFGDTDAMSDVMTERLRRRGINVIKSVVGVTGGISEYWVVSRYYAKSHLPLSLNELNFYRTVAECDKERARIQSFLESGSVPPLAVFCTDDLTLARAHLYYVDLNGDYLTEKAPQMYTDFASCVAGQASMEQAYRDRLGRDLLGSLCIHEDVTSDLFHLLLFSNRR